MEGIEATTAPLEMVLVLASRGGGMAVLLAATSPGNAPTECHRFKKKLSKKKSRSNNPMRNGKDRKISKNILKSSGARKLPRRSLNLLKVIKFLMLRTPRLVLPINLGVLVKSVGCLTMPPKTVEG